MAFNTKINLSDAKVYQADGQQLTLSGDTSIASGGTLAYLTDQSAIFNVTPFAIPDVAWVTGKTNVISTTAGNGLTKLGDNRIVLGGTLTGNTTVAFDNNKKLCLGTGCTYVGINTYGGGGAVSVVACCSTQGTCGDFLVGKDASSLIQYSSGGTLSSIAVQSEPNNFVTMGAYNYTANTYTYFTIGPYYTCLRTAANPNFTGIQYDCNYGANFTARSIPDAQWVTGKTNAISVTAGNGLTKLGDNRIVLGGALTGTTTINGAQTLDINQTVLNLSGNTSVNINGTAVTLQSTPPTGLVTDSVVVWDSVDKQLKIVSGGNNTYTKTIVTISTTGTTASTYVQLISGATSFTLPSAPLAGQVFKIKDAIGTALASPVVIDAGAGKTIDGPGNQCALINSDYGALELMYGATNQWFSLAFVN